MPMQVLRLAPPQIEKVLSTEPVPSQSRDFNFSRGGQSQHFNFFQSQRGGQSWTLTYFSNLLLTGRHLANSGGGQLKKNTLYIQSFSLRTWGFTSRLKQKNDIVVSGNSPLKQGCIQGTPEG